jgi:DNA-binding LacI/PurR family transcriptional regulator
MAKALTLKELAGRLDVAPSTVSRALSGGVGVGAAKVREIRRVADEMNYRPKPMRRTLSRTIGLIIATEHHNEPDDAFQSETIYEITRALAGSDWHIHIEFVDRLATSHTLPAVVRESRVDGVLLSGHPPVDFCRLLRDDAVPIVVLQDTLQRTGCTCIIPDVAGATESSVNRLIEMGHRRIGIVTVPTEFPTVQRRYEGYQRAIRAAGITPADGLEVKVASSSLHQGQAAVRQLLAAGERPTAIVFVTDRLALGGMNELARARLRIPEDISLIGHDNSSLAKESDPPLTSVDLNFGQTARRAVALLQEWIVSGAADAPTQIEIPCQVVWRASCGPAAPLPVGRAATQVAE